MVTDRSNVQIKISRSKRFVEQVVEEDSHDPFGHLKILINESYLIGGEDTHVGIWVTTDLIRLLTQTEAVLAGEKNWVAFDNGPSYLVVEPSNEGDELINVTHCLLFAGVENPDKRLPMEETFVVSKRVWIEELLSVAEEHYEELLELNPCLENNIYICELFDEIKNTKRRLATHFGE